MRVLVASDLKHGLDATVRCAAALAEAPADALAVITRDGAAPPDVVNRAVHWKADILVVNGRGLHGSTRVLPELVEAVVRRRPQCSVLVVRPHEGRGLVVAATDLSERSVAAVLAAAAEARRRHARLEVVHAIGFLDVEATYLLELATPSAPRRTVYEAAAHRLAEWVADLGIDATCKILDGPAAAAIVAEASSVDAALVVVGSGRGSQLARRVLSSVPDKVMRAATCSVLVVPTSATPWPR